MRRGLRGWRDLSEHFPPPRPLPSDGDSLSLPLGTNLALPSSSAGQAPHCRCWGAGCSPARVRETTPDTRTASIPQGSPSPNPPVAENTSRCPGHCQDPHVPLSLEQPGFCCPTGHLRLLNPPLPASRGAFYPVFIIPSIESVDFFFLT